MIVVMASSDSPRLTLATASRDFLATVDYPLRPAVSRSWGKPQRPRTRWKFCYFPQSFPVYRMQRLVSVVLCLLGLLLLSLVAFVLVQVAPTSQVLRGGLVMAANTRNNGMSADDNRKWDVGLGIGRTARKLEDHPEYKRSVEENYSEDDALDEADDEDDLVLNDNYDEEEEEEEEEEENNNPVFDMTYFDFSIKEGEADDPHSKTRKGPAEQQNTGSAFFRTPTVLVKWKNLPKLNLVNDYGLEIIEDGVVFSSSVEALLKEERLSDAMVGQVQEKLRSQEVTGLQEPTWERCGRPKNQWVELGSGSSAACARYRYPDDYLLVGEVLSFYLSRLLGVGHVPPVALSDPASGRWEPVASQMSAAGWGDAPVVVLTPWVHGLVRDHMPSVLLDVLLKNSTLSVLEEEEEEASQMTIDGYEGHKVYKVAGLKDQRTLKQSVDGETKRQDEGKMRQVVRGSRALKQAAERDLVRLLQWSDLLVFDYLTGNYDRVAYMQDAAEKEGRPQIMTGTIHNLVRSEATDALWLLDNESGLVDAYTLLYGTADPVQSARFSAFHTRMLKSMCVFRRSTMEAVLGLAHHPAPETLLVDFVKLHEPLFGRLPDPLENKLFMKHFPQRLAQVHDWMVKCAKRVQESSKTPLRKR